MAPLVVREPAEYFPSLVDKQGEGKGSCWLWRSSVKDGYGYLLIDGKRVKAHRFAYSLWVGPLPEGRYVYHRCGNPLCVRPDHLRLTDGRYRTRH